VGSLSRCSCLALISRASAACRPRPALVADGGLQSPSADRQRLEYVGLYIVDIASLILRGPHAAMIVGAASGWSSRRLNARSRTAAHRTLFNMSVLVLTVQAAGQVYQWLGGTANGDLRVIAMPPGGHDAHLLFLTRFRSRSRSR